MSAAIGPYMYGGRRVSDARDAIASILMCTRFRGIAPLGYHVCFTRRRSPVRARAGAKSAGRTLQRTFLLVDSAMNEYT